MECRKSKDRNKIVNLFSLTHDKIHPGPVRTQDMTGIHGTHRDFA